MFWQNAIHVVKAMYVLKAKRVPQTVGVLIDRRYVDGGPRIEGNSRVGGKRRAGRQYTF